MRRPPRVRVYIYMNRLYIERERERNVLNILDIKKYIQNMNYGILIYNKIKTEMFEMVRFLEMYFGIVGVFCTINCYF